MQQVSQSHKLMAASIRRHIEFDEQPLADLPKSLSTFCALRGGGQAGYFALGKILPGGFGCTALSKPQYRIGALFRAQCEGFAQYIHELDHDTTLTVEIGLHQTGVASFDCV